MAEFEPFTEAAIEARKYAPDVIVRWAKIAFASTQLTEAEKAEVQVKFRSAIVHLCHLAEIGLAAPRSSQRVN